jgi:hypothetical protein
VNIRERLDRILPRIQTREFLAGTGLGNELGFFIFDYPPQDELFVREYVASLRHQLAQDGSGIKLLELDLLRLLLELLESKHILDKIGPMEQSKGDEFLRKALHPLLKPENFIQIIKIKLTDHNLIFITGVGKVWPLVRSHTILNNLQPVFDTIPVIMFFPGVYNKTELQLFGKFKDDNYYRAFKLVDD